ncbi:hypothetical protein C487_03678 [Natrinema pallidum DSM 3751]|nr:hypothetical protein C487_03678 [Natrinema pallidum DSM 3751]
MGFAGTAAAGGEHHDDDDDKRIGDLGIAETNIEQGQDVSQVNQIEQNALQFADQNATGVDVDFNERVMDGGDNGADGTQPGIQTVTFTQSEGPNPVAVFEWDGDEFVLIDSIQSVEVGDITVTATAFNEQGEPIEATYTLNDGLPPGQAPTTATVASNGQTCDFTVPEVTGAPDLPVSGTVSVCSTDGNGDNGGTGGVTIDGSTGDQTINQTLEQSVDASNNNGQTANGSAFSGNLAALIAG